MSLLETEVESGPGTPARTRQIWRWLRTNRAAVTGLAIVTVLIVVAIAAPLLTALEGQDPTTFHSGLLDSARGGVPHGVFGGVSTEHWLGVEPGTGRDVFARAVYGARISLVIALGATVLEMVFGTMVGLVAGLGGRRTDAALSRLIDLWVAFPYFLLALALMAIVPQSVPRPLILVFVITITNWSTTARLVRAQSLSLRTRDYVAAARLSGARPVRIALREVLPGLTTPLITLAAFKIPSNMVVEAALSFLGVGVRPPTPSWGQMLSTATTWYRADPMYIIVPGALLVLTLLAFTLLADGIRTALDPRTESRT